jgi:uncharacterized protein
MQFLNTEVDLSLLPAVEDLQLKPISGSYLKILRIEWTITTIFIAIVAAALIYFIPALREGYSWLFIMIGLLALMIFYRIVQEKSFPYRAYAVRDHDIVYESGWIIRSTRICPLNRVMNCSIHSGPLERKHGLSTLSLYTAGSSGADMRIAGLKTEEAESIRQFVLTRINEQSKD